MTHELKLSNGGVTLIDEADLCRPIEYQLARGGSLVAVISECRWNGHKNGGNGGLRYATTAVREAATNRNAFVFLHRLIAGAAPGQFVDHRNRNPLDNRRKNLRICTQAENTRNSRGYARTSRFKGVHLFSKNSKRFRAQIRVARVPIVLGYFDDESEAARAYDAAAREHFGEFAYLNFPQNT